LETDAARTRSGRRVWVKRVRRSSQRALAGKRTGQGLRPPTPTGETERAPAALRIGAVGRSADPKKGEVVLIRMVAPAKEAPERVAVPPI